MRLRSSLTFRSTLSFWREATRHGFAAGCTPKSKEDYDNSIAIARSISTLVVAASQVTQGAFAPTMVCEDAVLNLVRALREYVSKDEAIASIRESECHIFVRHSCILGPGIVGISLVQSCSLGGRSSKQLAFSCRLANGVVLASSTALPRLSQKSSATKCASRKGLSSNHLFATFWRYQLRCLLAGLTSRRPHALISKRLPRLPTERKSLVRFLTSRTASKNALVCLRSS